MFVTINNKKVSKKSKQDKSDILKLTKKYIFYLKEKTFKHKNKKLSYYYKKWGFFYDIIK